MKSCVQVLGLVMVICGSIASAQEATEVLPARSGGLPFGNRAHAVQQHDGNVNGRVYRIDESTASLQPVDGVIAAYRNGQQVEQVATRSGRFTFRQLRTGMVYSMVFRANNYYAAESVYVSRATEVNVDEKAVTKVKSPKDFLIASRNGMKLQNTVASAATLEITVCEGMIETAQTQPVEEVEVVEEVIDGVGGGGAGAGGGFSGGGGGGGGLGGGGLGALAGLAGLAGALAGNNGNGGFLPLATP